MYGGKIRRKKRISLDFDEVRIEREIERERERLKFENCNCNIVGSILCRKIGIILAKIMVESFYLVEIENK